MAEQAIQERGKCDRASTNWSDVQLWRLIHDKDTVGCDMASRGISALGDHAGDRGMCNQEPVSPDLTPSYGRADDTRKMREGREIFRFDDFGNWRTDCTASVSRRIRARSRGLLRSWRQANAAAQIAVARISIEAAEAGTAQEPEQRMSLLVRALEPLERLIDVVQCV